MPFCICILLLPVFIFHYFYPSPVFTQLGMSDLVVEILDDYGTICKAIGLFLIKQNANTLGNIVAHTSLLFEQVKNGLSLLIQRRMVKYYKYESRTYYFLDKDQAIRRLMFPIYTDLIEKQYGVGVSRIFMGILCNGLRNAATIKQHDLLIPLIDTGVVQIISNQEAMALTTITKEIFSQGSRIRMAVSRAGEDDVSCKVRKTPNDRGYYIVNYFALDKLVLGNEIVRYVKYNYSSLTAEVFASALKCIVISKKTILDNLATNEASVCQKGDITNNIDVCLAYLLSAKLLRHNSDSPGIFLRSLPELHDINRHDVINRIIAQNDKHALRLYNLIVDVKQVDDRDISPLALLSSCHLKRSLVYLHRFGFLRLRYSALEGGGIARYAQIWDTNIEYTVKCISKHLKDHLACSLRKLNSYWSLCEEDRESNKLHIQISDMLGLVQDYFSLVSQFE